MKRYVSILRGINVSGKRKILMADLKQLYQNLGFGQVETYIQSGNVAFNFKEENELNLAKNISKAIKEQYTFDVPVIVVRADDLKQVIGKNPFVEKPGIDLTKLHVTFLSEQPQAEKVESLDALSFLPNEFKIVGKNIYLHCPKNYGDSKLNNNFFERKLKVTATTRNWKTVNKLLQMAENE